MVTVTGGSPMGWCRLEAFVRSGATQENPLQRQMPGVRAGVAESGLLFWQLWSRKRSPDSREEKKIAIPRRLRVIFQVSSLQIHVIKSTEMPHIQDSEGFHSTKKLSLASIL